jgi:hypothetical protein
MALSKSMADELSGQGRIRATAKLPEIDAYIRKANKGSRGLVPSESMILTQEANAQIRVIKMNWPVETGTSRAGWSYFIKGNPGQVAIVFENPVFYSAWIVRKGSHSVAAGGEPWFHKLLPAVWNAGKPRLIARLKEQVDKTQKEIEALKAQGFSQKAAQQQAGQGRVSTEIRSTARRRSKRSRTQAERLKQALQRVI